MPRYLIPQEITSAFQGVVRHPVLTADDVGQSLTYLTARIAQLERQNDDQLARIRGLTQQLHQAGRQLEHQRSMVTALRSAKR